MNRGSIERAKEKDRKGSKMDVGAMSGKDGWDEFEKALHLIKERAKGHGIRIHTEAKRKTNAQQRIRERI